MNLAYLYDAFREALSDGRRIPSGKDAHLRERNAARELSRRVPHAGFVFRSEREFLDRAVNYLIKYHRIDTIVIAGAGLPSLTGDDLHAYIRRCEDNHRARNRANVIYVERDPLTRAVMRTIADPRGGVYVVGADPWNPTAMWDTLYAPDHHGSPSISPQDDRVALILAGVMSFHGGTRAEVAHVVQEHIAHLPVGSFLALTHLLMPEHPEMAAHAIELETALHDIGPGTGTLATHSEIAAMVAGTDLVHPGIVPAFDWYPDGPPSPPVCGYLNAAVLTQKLEPDEALPEPPWRPPRT
ncbi:SAM-dependent methyltransferase [Amycolatopsis sp. CA-126428]|uniref:SAM-dependent methyltransferase n=1 Tax=Amycolatopsis sp. CA-126428 TaxID=2073158 RepID=UPI00130498D7|nr:SAM-dependent methyltransferase [Amycolatopsis sp. CA-126428]